MPEKRRESTMVTLSSERPPFPIRVLRRLRKAIRNFFLKRRLGNLGSGSDIAAPLFMVGGSSISIGNSVWIWRGARLEAMGPAQSEPKIRIGDGCKLHPGLHIGAVERVDIGQGVLMAANVYISDHDHDFSDPFDPVVSNNRLDVAPVEIGDYAWLGEQVMVLKGVKIGERSIIGAGSVVTRDVPPLSIAVGSPARVVRHYDLETKQWRTCVPRSEGSKTS